MATQTSLAIRRNEANARIAKAVQALAKQKGIKLDALDVRHRDPQIEAVLNVEAVAAALDELVKAQYPSDLGAETGEQQPPVTVETIKESPLKTVETVEIKSATNAKPKGRR